VIRWGLVQAERYRSYGYYPKLLLRVRVTIDNPSIYPSGREWRLSEIIAPLLFAEALSARYF
jgi:hypothetical protein